MFKYKRRFVLSMSVLAASAMLATACGDDTGGANDGKVKVSMFVFAGSHQEDVPKEVVKQYEADHPDVDIELIVGNNTLYSKMLAAKRTTPDDNYVDFGLFNAQTVAKGTADGMWDPIDPEAVPNSEHVLDKYRVPGDVALPYQAALIGLVYNKNEVTTPPTSWSALWDDPDYAGKVTFFDHDWVPLVLAARLNGGDEKNIDVGFDTWRENANQLAALVSSNDQLQSLLVSGQATLAPWYAAIYRDWENQGAPVGLAIPEEGAVAFPIYWTMVKDMTADEKAVAEDIIDLMLSAENAGKYGDLTFSAPLTDNAELTPEQQADPTLNAESVDQAIQIDWATVGEQNAEWTERWDTEVKPEMK